jgi:hypothetical protein
MKTAFISMMLLVSAIYVFAEPAPESKPPVSLLTKEQVLEVASKNLPKGVEYKLWYLQWYKVSNFKPSHDNGLVFYPKKHGDDDYAWFATYLITPPDLPDPRAQKRIFTPTVTILQINNDGTAEIVSAIKW